MKSEKIELDEWKRLYEAAVRFKETECWNWIADIDIFGVENIDTHEIGYCCVMGNAGQVFGISIYVGDDGLKSYMDTLYPNVPFDDLGYIQNCITMYFEDRESLNREDLNIIKQLGLKFRGKKQWPQFRNYKPNYFPSQISKSEVKYMAYALEQIVNVALRCREDEELLKPEDENKILVRASRVENKKVLWEDKYINLDLEENNNEYEKVNEIALKRIKDNRLRKTGVWEVDFFNAPAMVKESGRPFYPLMFMIAEAESGVMLDMKMTSDFEGYIGEFRDEFIDLLARNKQIPEVIVVQRKKAFQMLEPISLKLGIELQTVEELYSIQEFRKGLEQFL
ncbi:DUF7309 domain-containing protein [Acetivibrio cellulolyticus]|uniref:DUF7309 domain-containing protein n=1 Tax=Acetivibrio cellulolyticus TaxID=35830 RepID=UPI0001E3050A|nr:hypothetical protein [Acetivibrio cellulolyticus]